MTRDRPHSRVPVESREQGDDRPAQTTAGGDTDPPFGDTTNRPAAKIGGAAPILVAALREFAG